MPGADRDDGGCRGDQIRSNGLAPAGSALISRQEVTSTGKASRFAFGQGTVGGMATVGQCPRGNPPEMVQDRPMNAVSREADYLDPADLAWAKNLAASLVTAALAVAGGDDPVAEPVYNAAREQALSVPSEDGLAADRWLAAMFFVAAHAAGLLRQLGRHQNLEPEQLWRRLLLRRLSNETT